MALSVTIASTARAKYVDLGTLRLLDQTGDQPNTATFECFGFTPALADTIVIDDGTELFDGYILKVTQYHRKLHERVRYLVECVDQSWDLNKELITGQWTATTLGAIVADIDNVSGWSSNLSAGASAVVVTSAGAGLESRLALLSRLCRSAGCWYDIDRQGKTIFVRLLSETIHAGPNISAADLDWWDLVHTQDAAQLRNQVFAAGPSLTLLERSSSAASYAVSAADYALIGFTGDQGLVHRNDYGATWGAGAPASASTSTVATATAAGATSLPLAAIPTGAYKWVLVDGQYLYTTGNSGGALTGIPASGGGSIVRDIPVGATVATVPELVIATGSPIAQTYPATLEIVNVNASTSAPYGTVSGFLRGYTAEADAIVAAASEVTRWRDPAVTGRVTTTDAGAVAGYDLHIDVFGISDTYRIERVQSTWDAGRGAMVHVCEFATQRRDLITLLLTFG